MKIFLIGMPGAGKSTLGSQLSEKLILPFIDLDKEIEQTEEATVQEIFRERGEEYFRKIESDHLKEITNRQHSFVMATGGGTPCFYESMEFMKAQGITVFMDVDIDALHTRVKNSTDRPLLSIETAEELKQRLVTLRDKRIADYSKAHLTFSAASLSADAVAHALLVFKKESPQSL